MPKVTFITQDGKEHELDAEEGVTLMEIGNWVDADDHTGRLIHVPNGLIFSATLANYGKGFKYIWNEMPVLVTFESDWRKAKKILVKIVHENSIIQTKSACLLYTSPSPRDQA